MNDHERREWLLRRIEMEANAYANGEATRHDMLYGRVLGLLEVGVAFGYWSCKTADGFSETVRHRYQIGRGVRRLRRG
jgi:hypothetical protein